MSGDSYETLPVRIEGHLPTRKVYEQYRTVKIVLADNETIGDGQLLPDSDNRVCAYVYPLDDDVYVSEVLSDARRGAGVLIPKGLTFPWPLHGQHAIYVAVPDMSGPVSRVSVTAAYYKV